MFKKNKATTPDETYFINITTIDWKDVLTKLNPGYVIANALKYCQEKKKKLTVK